MGSHKSGNLHIDTYLHKEMPFEHEGGDWGDDVLATQGTPKIAKKTPEARREA